jgi:protein phosphatase 2C family protein 2/3
MQGWRINMEDSHTHILSLPDDPDAAFFAVYDGHGGSKISEYAGKHLHKFITNREEYKDGDAEKGMKQAFLEIDRVMLEDETLKNEQSGSTAVAIIIKNGHLYCANVGDSRAVASIGGRAEPLSNDHKPNNKEEYDRIVAAGGWVDFNRVNGNLALSRALGDFIFKRNQDKPQQEQIVTGRWFLPLAGNKVSYVPTLFIERLSIFMFLFMDSIFRTSKCCVSNGAGISR